MAGYTVNVGAPYALSTDMWLVQFPSTESHSVTGGEPQLGLALGAPDGDAVGELDGEPLGELDGNADGLALGISDGLADGLSVGDLVGAGVGHMLGPSSQLQLHTPVMPGLPVAVIVQLSVAKPAWRVGLDCFSQMAP